MKLDIKDLHSILARFEPALRFLKRYMVILFFIVFIGIYGFLVYRINALSSASPSEDTVTEKLKTIQHPKVDQSSLDKIQQLQDQHIEVKSLFENARNNPFSE